jgi:hypothetical protein
MSTKYPGNIVTSGAAAGYSVAFDGTGDSLTLADNTAFEFGSGNFTVEAWVYVTATPGASGASIVTKSSATYPGGYEFNFVVQNDRKVFFGFYTTTQVDLLGTTAISLNTWNHIAVSRSGSNFALFVNGTREATNTGGGTIQATSSSLYIGDYGGGSRTLTGNISNLRIVKGSAVYDPTQTTILVPTQLFAITNTSLLTCNSPAIVDQSTNAFAITVNGNAAASTFSPFPGYQAYNPALGAATPGVWTVSEALQARQTRQWNMYDPYFQNTTLLLHGNGTNGAQNNTFLDSSSNNFTITRNGNTTQGTFSPFSQTGWSNYFDGSSSLSLPANILNFIHQCSANYTLEFWFYGTSTSNQVVLATTSSASTQIGFFVAVNNRTTGDVELQIARGSSGNVYAVYTNGSAWSTNTWNHVAFTFNFSNTSFAIYINGISQTVNTSGSATFSASNASGAPVIGTTTSGILYYTGYLSNLRAVNGARVYTSNFTPPTAALGATSGGQNPPTGTQTAILTCQSNRFVDNSTNAYSVSVNTGTPSVQAFSPFYPVVAYTPQAQGGSGYFDGTGDYLTLADSTAWDLTGDYTLEMWLYPLATTGGIFGIGDYRATFNGMDFYFNANKIELYVNGAAVLTGATTIVRNQWYHLALVRSGSSTNNTKLYINGVQDAQGTNNTSFTGVAGNGASIGNDYGGSYGAASVNGYISGLRLLKGTAQYTSAFTPPTSPPTAITNTQLLTNFTNAGIIDSTGDNVLETAVNAQISTTRSKFGGSSMYFDQSSWLTFLGGPNLAFGTGNYTVEAWVNFASITASDLQVIFMSGGTGGNNFYLSAKRTDLNVGTGTTFISTQLTTFSANTWYHVAACRSGTTLRLFVNGTQIGSSVTDSTNWISSGLGRVGSNEFGTQPVFGYIQDLRITKGYARYTANFTPQTSQWQDQ